MIKKMDSAEQFTESGSDRLAENLKKLYTQIFGDCDTVEYNGFVEDGDAIVEMAKRLKAEDKIDVRIKIESSREGKVRLVKDVLLSNLIENGIEVNDNIDMLIISGRVRVKVGKQVYEGLEDIVNMKVFVAGEEYIRGKKAADAPNFYVVDYDQLVKNGLIKVNNDTLGV